MKSKTKTLPTDAVLRDMLEQAGLDSAGVQFRLLGGRYVQRRFCSGDKPAGGAENCTSPPGAGDDL